MKRLPTLALALLFVGSAAACKSDNPSGPSQSGAPRLLAQLLPSNEVPAITNADASGRGSVVVTMNVTRDAAQQITAATADFQVSLNSFPAGAILTGAHIHTGVAGVNGGVVVNLNLQAGEFVLANGTATIARTGVTISNTALAQAILNNPAAYYFNVHTTLNLGGAVRGQLVAQ